MLNLVSNIIAKLYEHSFSIRSSESSCPLLEISFDQRSNNAILARQRWKICCNDSQPETRIAVYHDPLPWLPHGLQPCTLVTLAYAKFVQHADKGLGDFGIGTILCLRGGNCFFDSLVAQSLNVQTKIRILELDVRHFEFCDDAAWADRVKL